MKEQQKNAHKPDQSANQTKSFNSLANDLSMITILTSDFPFSILGNIWSSWNIMTIQKKMLTLSDFSHV